MRAVIERMTVTMCLVCALAVVPRIVSAEPVAPTHASPARSLSAVVAMITAVQGKVSVQAHGGAAATPAGMLTELHVGDQVTVSTDGASTLSFASNGTRVYLKGGAKVTVNAQGVSPLGPLVRVARPQARQGLALPAGVNIQRMMASSTSRGSDIDLVALLTQKSMLPGMAVSWYTNVKPRRQTLRVYRGKNSPGSPSEAIYVKNNLAPDVRSLRLPGGLLKPGDDGYLEIALEAPTPTLLLDLQPVHVLSTRDSRHLQDARAQADRELAANPQDETPRVILMYRYLEAELDELALQQAQALLRQDPQNVALLHVLENIYNNLGMVNDVKKIDDRIKALSPP